MVTKISLIIALLLIVAGGITIFNIYNSKDKRIIRNGKILHIVENYRYIEPGENTCLALSPECGYCAGEVIEKKCYEEKN